MTYWVYDNIPTNCVTIHEAGCSHCKNGQGTHGTKERRNDEWIQSKTFSEAKSKAERLKRRYLRICGHCKPDQIISKKVHKSVEKHAVEHTSKSKILTKNILIKSGFYVAGQWTLEGQKIKPPLVKRERAVYAFSIDGEIVYVGIASRDLANRLNFYANPGKSQTTNLRLNPLIREVLEHGNRVEILMANPDTSEWNGLPVDLVSGLEAALIESYRPKWNQKGTR